MFWQLCVLVLACIVSPSMTATSTSAESQPSEGRSQQAQAERDAHRAKMLASFRPHNGRLPPLPGYILEMNKRGEVTMERVNRDYEQGLAFGKRNFQSPRASSAARFGKRMDDDYQNMSFGKRTKDYEEGLAFGKK